MNKILILTVGLLSLLFALYLIFAPKKAEKEQLPPIQVAPSYSPSPRISEPRPPPFPSQALQIVNIEPKEDLSLGYNPVTEIKFTFSEDIDLDNFLLEVSPGTQIRITPDTTTHTYAISGKEGWPEGINTFTIKAGTKSLTGKTVLKDTFIYKINIQFPKNPPPDADI